MPALISLDDVMRAREAIAGRLHRTPTFTSASLSQLSGAQVHLKAELFQRTGSFKPRGVLTKLASLTPEETSRGVIGISAGNHAQALAYCSALEGIDALLVMWQGADESKRAATTGYGAAVHQEARDPTEAFAVLARLQEETGRTLVHPFDDPLVIAGAGTVGLEIEEDAPDADVVVVPVGGGGLVAGITAALGDRMRVVAVEPEGSQAYHEGLRKGAPTPVEPRSIADGLSAPFAGALPLEICRDIELATVSEEEIEDAFRFLYERTKLACEPAAAAAAAAWLSGKVGGRAPVLVISGGNVARSTASAILAAR